MIARRMCTAAFAWGLALAISPAHAEDALSLCKAIKNDAARLKCFDGAVELPEKAIKTEPGNWNVQEERAPLDDSPAVTAILLPSEGKGSLALRCREHRTDVIITPAQFWIQLGNEPIKVTYRIGTDAPVNGLWHPSSNGQAVFANAAIPFIRALPDDVMLFIRVIGRREVPSDNLFSLGKVSAIRDRIAEACEWNKAAKPATAAPAAKSAPAPTPGPAKAKTPAPLFPQAK